MQFKFLRSNNNPMRFFSSDHHFFHKNVIHYCKRPYTSVEEMNEDMIWRWNCLVSDMDTVYYLGDFSLSKKALPIVKRLKGKKILIPGNHDSCFPGHKKHEREAQVYRDAGFQCVFTLPHPIHIQDAECVLWHLPYIPDPVPLDYDLRYEAWRIPDAGKVLLHGHVHERWLKRGRMINVGVDVWNGYPVSEEQVYGVIKDPRDHINTEWGSK